MPSAQGTIGIAASPLSVRAVITDFSKYPEFVPEVVEATVLRAVGASNQEEWTVHFALRVVRPVRYTLRLWSEPERVDGTLIVRWELVEGSVLRANAGSWTLTPGPAGTTATYDVSLELALFVPKSLIKLLAGTNLPQVLDAFRRRVESLPRDNSGQTPPTG